MTEPVAVRCEPAGEGWSCSVQVGWTDDATDHVVSVSRDELTLYAPGATDPQRLVEASFAYLLEREPKELIMRSFTLSTIERYFPGYPREIGERL